jgi:phosphoheptose isomerase
MAQELGIFDWPMTAAADYSSSQYYLVAQNTSNGRATKVSTAGAKVLGVLQDDPSAAAQHCVVRLGGVSKCVAGAAVSIGDALVADSSGRCITATANNQYVFGRALEAATAAGDIISVALGGCIGAEPSVVLADGFLPLPLAQARELSSNAIINLAGHVGGLGADSTPILQAINAGTDQALRLAWAASNVDKITWQVPLPPDLDDSANMTIHALAYMAGATDTPTLTWEAFFGIGDTDCGGATGALGATVAEVTRTIAAANVEAAPDTLTLTVAPGAHTTDIAYMTAAWLEYTRK